MIAIGHTAVGFSVGLLVARVVPDPFLAGIIVFCSGIALHYLTDWIPHGHLTAKQIDPYDSHLIYWDLFGGGLFFLLLSLFYFGLSKITLIILISIFANQLSDVLAFLTRRKILPFQGLFVKEFAFHQATHWHGLGMDTLPISRRDIWQLIVILGALVLPILTRN